MAGLETDAKSFGDSREVFLPNIAVQCRQHQLGTVLMMLDLVLITSMTNVAHTQTRKQGNSELVLDFVNRHRICIEFLYSLHHLCRFHIPQNFILF